MRDDWNSTFRASRLLTYTLLVCSLTPTSQVVQAQRVDHIGSEFFIGFMPNEREPDTTTELLLTSDVETSVTVEYPVIDPTFSATFSLTSGTITHVDLGADPAFRWTPGVMDSNVVRVVGDEPFAVYASNRQDASTDVAVALPVDALGTEYLVQSYFQYYTFSAFVVVGIHDGTELTITPSRELQGGHPADTPIHLRLNRGEAFLGLSLGDSLTAEGDLTGTEIQASRPVQVSNGHVCGAVRDDGGSCDHLFEVALPLSGWGLDAIAAPPPYEPEGTWYRVLASEDQTTVRHNGVDVASLNRGEFIELTALQGAQVFEADRPILVTQFLRTISNSKGDPSMLTILPPESYLTRYTLATIGGAQFREDYVTLIAHEADVAAGTMLLNAVPVGASDFTDIPGTEYAYAILPVTDGTYATQSDHPHSATIYGIDPFDTYIYHGGGTFDNPLSTAAESVLPGEITRIGGSYPNPFSASTRIPVELRRASHVRLTVHDVLGREVARLLDQDLGAGRHAAEWNGTGDGGNDVPPGLYLYRVVVEGEPRYTGTVVRVR